MKMCKLFLTAILASGVMALSASAKQCTWTGAGGDNAWLTDANWDQALAKTDTAVFTNSVTVSLTGFGTDNSRMPGRIFVNSGDVTIAFATEFDLFLYGTETEIYVAENASLTIDGFRIFQGYTKSWSTYYYSNGQSFRKTGAGTLTLRGGRFGQNYNSSGGLLPLHALVSVEAGVLACERKSGWSSHQFYETNVVVHSGAELRFDMATGSSDFTRIDLRDGAVLRMKNCLAGKIAFGLATLTGSGKIIGDTGTNTSVVALRMNQNVPQYTGTVEGDVEFGLVKDVTPLCDFVVQSSNQFAKCKAIRNPGTWLKFKSGVGTFDLGGFDGVDYGTIYPQDLDGNPVTLIGQSYCGTNLSWSGVGNVCFRGKDDSGFSGSRWALSGWARVLEGGDVSFGASGNAFDFTLDGGNVKGIAVDAGGTASLRGSSEPVEVEIPVRGRGTFVVGANGHSTRLTDLSLDGAEMIAMYSPTEFAAGDVNVAELQGNGGRARTNCVTGARIYSGWDKGELEDNSALSSRRGVTTTGSIGSYDLSMEGGEFWWRSGNALNNIHLRAGIFHPSEGCIRHQTKKGVEDGLLHVRFDGGTAELDFVDGTTFRFFRYGADATHDIYDSAEYTRMYVTEKGGTIVAHRPNGHAEVMTVVTTNALENAPGVATSGQLTFKGWSDFTFGAPMTLTGPVAFRDGTAVLSPAQLAGGASPFGTGSLRLRNARIFCDARSGTGHGVASIPFDNGEVVYEGSCGIVARQDNSEVAKAIAIKTARRAGKGSVLYLRDGVSTSKTVIRIGEDDRSTVRFETAPEVDGTTGLLRQPILIAQSHRESLATYDGERGIVPHDTKYTHVTAAAEADATKVLYSHTHAAALEIPANTTVYAAALRCENYASFNIPADSKIVVGNGTDPAIVSLSVCGKVTGNGKGILDFGTSEGIISLSDTGNKSTATISAVLAGTGGVTYAGDPDTLRARRVRVQRSSSYTGGTRIAGVSVEAYDRWAFGDAASTVEIFGGEQTGGAVVFANGDDSEDFTYDFKIAGRGYHNVATETGAYSNKGCLEFWNTTPLSGSVEIVEEAEVNAAAGKTGIFKGVVSGDRLKLFQSEGVIRLANVNTYTGGTEVAQATLAVTREGGLGTGEILLDNGTVVFENSSAIAVPNKLRGTGTLKAVGAAVDFTGDTSEVGDVTVDYAGVNVRLTSYPYFASMVRNSSTARTTLTFAAPGAYAIDPGKFDGTKIIIALEDGATLDLGGGTLTVHRFDGDRKAVNGAVVETHPRSGTLLLVR